MCHVSHWDIRIYIQHQGATRVALVSKLVCVMMFILMYDMTHSDVFTWLILMCVMTHSDVRRVLLRCVNKHNGNQGALGAALVASRCMRCDSSRCLKRFRLMCGVTYFDFYDLFRCVWHVGIKSQVIHDFISHIWLVTFIYDVWHYSDMSHTFRCVTWLGTYRNKSYMTRDSHTWLHKSCMARDIHIQPTPLGLKFSKARSSKLERLFCHVSVKRDVRDLSFELWNSIRKCYPKWDWLYDFWQYCKISYSFWMCMTCQNNVASHIWMSQDIYDLFR